MGDRAGSGTSSPPPWAHCSVASPADNALRAAPGRRAGWASRRCGGFRSPALARPRPDQAPPGRRAGIELLVVRQTVGAWYSAQERWRPIAIWHSITTRRDGLPAAATGRTLSACGARTLSFAVFGPASCGRAGPHFAGCAAAGSAAMIVAAGPQLRSSPRCSASSPPRRRSPARPQLSRPKPRSSRCWRRYADRVLPVAASGARPVRVIECQIAIATSVPGRRTGRHGTGVATTWLDPCRPTRR